MKLLVVLIRFVLTLRTVVILRKPLAMMALVRAYFLARVSKRPVMRGVDIVTSYRCNLSCHHCNISSMHQDNGQLLSLEEYREIEKQCSAMGVVQYCFTGGEPLLYPELEKLIAIFKPKRRVIVVQTNGSLIQSLEKAQWLRRIGVDVVNLSLDSGNPQEHDKNRGIENHYEQTMRAMEFSKKAGLQVVFGTFLTHQSLRVPGMLQLFEFARKNWVPVILNLAAPIGQLYDHNEMLLTPEDQEAVRQLTAVNPCVRLDMDSTINHYGCPGYKEKLYITPYGDVTGCTFVPITFGNVRQLKLSEIRDRALKSGLMSEFSKRCYAAENAEFIRQYMGQLHGRLPKSYHSLEHAKLPYGENRCVVCGSDAWKIALKQGEDYEYRTGVRPDLDECHCCGYVMMRPRPLEGQIADFYPAEYHAYQRPDSLLFKELSNINLQKRRKRYDRLTGGKGRVLDVGCGDGEILEFLSRFGYDCYGVEFKKDVAEAGRRKGLKIVHGTLESVRDWPEGYFDLIIVNHLIEHVQNPRTTLEKAVSLLKPGGWITGETPNYDCLERKLLGPRWSGYHVPRHLQIFSPKNLTRLCRETGFSEVRIQDSINPGQWALSLQNLVLRNFSKAALRNGKTSFYPACLAVAVPIVLSEKLFRVRSGIQYFEAKSWAKQSAF